jgi:signal peptidase I
MLQLIRVTGESLSPAYQEGDYVVITTIPFFLRSIKQGDTIVFKHASYGTMIKRVERVIQDQDQIYVVGSHENSIDSQQFGPIGRKSLLGKVLCHIPKPRR